MSIAQSSLDDLYPQSCPFCSIAQAFPFQSIPSSSNPLLSHPELPKEVLLSCIPDEGSIEPEKIDPACWIILNSENVLAFLDILPMTKGHLLVATRAHRQKLQDVGSQESMDIGFWLPLLSLAVMRTLGITDYNIVQNNGARAAQVVPHVHFHIIPRPETMPEVKNKSWTMFGRGTREDLDEEEAGVLAAKIRGELRKLLNNKFDDLEIKAKL
ncbi:HIT-like protein [Patellaria atrata CBS 101060]|uniref:HIT-like protein n=1 Tax=Patellaria atrata CBS 101060 TaxID=1346257 RepID=A0A9P4VQU7_9PEZI|nr:HIT-like protein [Patellaria atrata CBS 101060]